MKNKGMVKGRFKKIRAFYVYPWNSIAFGPLTVKEWVRRRVCEGKLISNAIVKSYYPNGQELALKTPENIPETGVLSFKRS